MGQRAGPGTEADSDDEILPAPLLRDEVDDLVAAWRAQRPDLDVEPMQVLSRISRLARHLDIARRGAFAEQLDVYGRAGEPCRRCGRRLIGTHAIDGRSTVFCASCQK